MSRHRSRELPRHARPSSPATKNNQCSGACRSKPLRGKGGTDAICGIDPCGCTRMAIQTCNRIQGTTSVGGYQKDITSGANALTYASSASASGVQSIPQMTWISISKQRKILFEIVRLLRAVYAKLKRKSALSFHGVRAQTCFVALHIFRDSIRHSI